MVVNHDGNVKNSSFGHKLTFEIWISDNGGFLVLAALLLQRRRGAEHAPHMRSLEIHKKSSEIYDLENEPRHVWILPGISEVTRDDIWHHETS